MCFVLYLKPSFMDCAFCSKHGYWGNIFRDAAKLASSSNERRIRRLHYPTGRSSTPLAPGCSTFSERISTSTMDRSHRERRKKIWHFSSGPPRSPDLIPCDFFLWGFIKEEVYVPSLPTTLDNLKNRITTAVNSVTQDLLQVWNEFSYHLDVTRAAGGGHTEHL
jgi:hypothetical protein